MGAGQGGDGENVLPSWFYLARAVVSLLVGVFMLLAETEANTPARLLIICAALLLMGYAPVDLVTFYRGRANGE